MEYAFETARLKLFLPSKGDTWFFIDRNLTVTGFKHQCQKEDPSITEIKFGDNGEDAKVYEALEKGVRVKINGNWH